MGLNFYDSMLVPFHDGMPSFINFRSVLDLLEFLNQVSQCLWPSDGGRVFELLELLSAVNIKLYVCRKKIGII